MPEAFIYSDPSLLRIDRPRCPNCQGRMMLARIEPSPSASDLRTFQCPKCEYVHKVMVQSDPMKSSKAGWANSDLHPPT
jgi:ribosomal protein S27AE